MNYMYLNKLEANWSGKQFMNMMFYDTLKNPFQHQDTFHKVFII